MRRPDPDTRIAVTGSGIICAIGRNREEVWRAITESRAGIGLRSPFPGESAAEGFTAEVRLGAGRRRDRRLSRTDRLAIIAAGEALEQAAAASPLPLGRAIVATGTSTGGLLEGEDYFLHRLIHGRRRSPASIVLQQPTSGPGEAVASAYGLGGGTVSNATACASAGAAIGMAVDYLRSRHCDVALAGGSDALCRLTTSGFNVLQAVDPEPCTPFAATRRGITLGEGAGFLVLERWEDAVARGARILAEVAGYGASCDAHHPTAPLESGEGAEAAMLAALADAQSSAAAVDYVNAHGTGTLLNDAAESRAIARVLGTGVPVSSSKSYFGHTLGASGGVEAVVTVLALLHQIAPPTLRLKNPSPECPLDFIPETPRPMPMTTALSNTFGFGGSNVALVLRRA